MGSHAHGADGKKGAWIPVFKEMFEMDIHSATRVMRDSERDATLRQIALSRASVSDCVNARMFAQQIESEDVRDEVLDRIEAFEDAVAAHG